MALIIFQLKNKVNAVFFPGGVCHGDNAPVCGVAFLIQEILHTFDYLILYTINLEFLP